jgi:thymidylate synthase
MMKILKFLLFIPLCCLAVFCTSCKNSHGYEKYVKELDSLKVVVEQAIGNFKTVDSVAVYNASIKQQTYTQFINANLKDTVSKEEALNLRDFSNTGTGLQLYLSKRQQWLAEANNTVNQLHNLSHDLKNGSVETDEAVEYIHNEKQNSEKIIEELKINTESVRAIMDTHAKTLPVAENIVKKLNHGSLPPLPLKTKTKF